MTGWQLLFLLYNVLPVPAPELDSAYVVLFPTEVACEAEGKRLTQEQVLPAGTRRVYSCVFIDFTGTEIHL